MPHSRKASLSLLLGPYLTGVILLIVLPALVGFAAAFTRYNGLTPPVFAGWQSFKLLAREPLFWVALRNSYLYVVLAVPLRLLGALGLALFYSAPRKGVGLYRALAYLPTVIPDPAYALIWTWIFNPLYGPLNPLLRALGLPAPGWLTDPAWGIPAVALISLFQVGEGFVILLAGLRQVPREVYEAARMDGAGRWQIFTGITLPLLSPWLVVLTLRDVVLSLQNTFVPAQLMTQGGPYYATFFLPMLIYETAFDGMRFGMAAAATLLLFIVTLLFSLLIYFLMDGWGLDED